MNISKNFDFGQNLRKISLLVKFSNNFELQISIMVKISILVKIFEKILF